jgi:hypothetical protein
VAAESPVSEPLSMTTRAVRLTGWVREALVKEAL